MDHATAMRKALAESYVLDELGENERAEFEEHFFACPECAEDVKMLAIFIDDVRKTLGKTPTGKSPTDTRRLRLRRRLLMLPVAAAIVLSLGLAVYQTAVTVPQLRRDLAQSRALQATSWHFLSVARSEPADIRISTQQRMIGLTLSRTGDEAPVNYRVDLRDANGALVLSSIVAANAVADELQLLLPVSELESGRYAVELSGIDSPEQQSAALEVTRYSFALTREEK